MEPQPLGIMRRKKRKPYPDDGLRREHEKEETEQQNDAVDKTQ